MSQIIVKNQPVSLTIFLRNTATGVGATGLTYSQVTASYKLANATTFTTKTLSPSNYLEIGGGFYSISFGGQTNATATIGSGPNGAVTLSAINSAKGAAGNAYTVQVVVPVSGTTPLTVALVGSAITVTLAVSAGVLVGASNTATLVAQAIRTALANFDAVASGSGVTALASNQGPLSFSGGADGELNATGNGILRASATSTDLGVESFLIIDTSSGNPTPTPNTPPDTTTVMGFLYDTDGTPLAGSSVVARLIELPLVQYTNSQSFAIASKPVVTESDSTGFFSLELITGATFDIFIADVNFRKMITVPTTSDNIFNIV